MRKEGTTGAISTPLLSSEPAPSPPHLPPPLSSRRETDYAWISSKISFLQEMTRGAGGERKGIRQTLTKMCSKSALFCIVTFYIDFRTQRWRIRFWRLESADWSSSPPPFPPSIACRFLIYSSQPKSPFRTLQFLPPSLHFAKRTLELRKMERLSTFPKIVSTSSFAIQLSIFLASRLLFLFLFSPP